MSDNRLALSDKTITLLTIFLFASFFLFENFIWGRYILLGTSGLILLINIIRHKGVIHIKFELWHYYILAIAIFSLMSAVWGISSQDSIQKFITTMEILIMLSFLYLYFQESDNIERLLNIVKWSGYLVGVISFLFYGYDLIILLLKTGRRLENGFSNVNSIGILCAIAIIIEFYEILYYKSVRFSFVFCVPSLIIVLASQSRKAFVLLLFGVFLVVMLSDRSQKHKLKMILRFVFIIIAFIVFGYLLSKLPVFSGINERFGYILETLRGQGEVGSSTYLRSQMIEIGWNCFKKNPIVGVGYGCPHVVNNQVINFDAYLHNNYIELLAGGGLVGFFLYYSFYYSIFKRIRKYKSVEHFGTTICVIIMILLLVSDLGMVNCYSKETYFYFMIFFLLVKELRKRRIENNNESFSN